MATINIKDIIVGERFRKTFEGIEDLAQSISEHGLIEPIVIDELNTLIAGERRLKACKLIKLESIEVRYLNDLTELEKKEIELEENLHRKDFSWQEEVVAKAKLHQLKQQLHGAAVRGKEGSGWGVVQTAEALGESPATVSIDMQLARGMKAFPELMKEKSKTTAFKKLKQMQESILQDELAKRMKQVGLLNCPNVILGDSVEELNKIESNSIDLVLTDPPYGIEVENSQTFGRMSTTNTRFEDGEFETFDLLDKVIPQLFRVLKDDKHLFMFCAIDKFATVRQLLIKHGFWVHHIPLIWDKGSGSYPSQSTTFVHSYEPFIHAMKGKRKLYGTPRDVFPISRVPSGKKIHPTEKPTQLLRDIINLSTLAGEKVLDPFAGSGSTIEACRDTNRQAIGIEKDDVHYKAICDRLNKEKNNGEVLSE